MQDITLTTDTSSSRITIGAGELQHLNSYIDADLYDKVYCIVDKNVFDLYGPVIEASLASSNITYAYTVFEALETRKNLQSIESILDDISQAQCTKRTLFVAIGGGIVCDMTGLIAGLWYRGCDVMYAPTTLLSMVDASVGGKCGVDFRGSKNQLGLIIQPGQVVVDPLVLQTLPLDIFQDGCAEVIKHACLTSPELFDQLTDHPLRMEDTETTLRYAAGSDSLEIPAHTCSYTANELENLIAQNIAIKASFVQEDEFDRGIRAALNFGHTAAHALEAASSMNICHGRAVALGIAFANQVGVDLGYTDAGFAQVTLDLLVAHGLLDGTESAELIQAYAPGACDYLTYDKKVQADDVKFVFVQKPGHYTIQKVPLDAVKEALNHFKLELINKD